MRIGSGLRFALPVFFLALTGGSAAGTVTLPAPEQLVPNTVARISGVPDRPGTITKAEFRHALVLAAAARGRHPAPEPGGRGYEQLRHAAVLDLLETIWIKGQAEEMNIFVTREQVRRELALIKRQSFDSPAEFREFMKESRFTRRDVYERVELQLLSIRIAARVLAGARTEAEERAVYKAFVAEFNERWRSRTVCAPEYVIEHCSNA